jgi:dephospho-CoA kinase
MSSQSNKPFKIGVTGGIACGKSLLRNILENNGVNTIDADEIVHDMLQNDKLIIDQIIEIFGRFILKEDGGINRKELAKIVFADPDKLTKLENIVHPHTYRVIRDFINKSESPVIAAVIPLLLENNRQNLFDSVWLITSDEKNQIERLKNRDNMPEDEARQRIATQMPQDMKIAMADVIIDNNSTVENVEEQVIKNLENIKKT